MRDTGSTGKSKGLKLDNFLRAIAKALIPAGRPDPFTDSDELQRCEPYQLLCVGLGLRTTQLERSLYPPMAIWYGSPSPEEARRRMETVSKNLRRTAKFFVFACSLLAGFNARMLPDVSHLQIFYTGAPGWALVGLFATCRLSLWWERYARPWEADSQDPWLRKVKLMQSFLLAGEFSPARFMARSGFQTLVILFLCFPPAYIVLRWFAGEPVPFEAGWGGIACRFMAALILTLLFAAICKANRIAAAIFQDEIDAFERAGFAPVSG